MTIRIVFVIAGIVGTFSLGMIIGEILYKNKVLPSAMAYGLYEKDQVWNRIRVDENGHVLCHKE